jgi:hypothetical protein
LIFNSNGLLLSLPYFHSRSHFDFLFFAPSTSLFYEIHFDISIVGSIQAWYARFFLSLILNFYINIYFYTLPIQSTMIWWVVDLQNWLSLLLSFCSWYAIACISSLKRWHRISLSALHSISFPTIMLMMIVRTASIFAQ